MTRCLGPMLTDLIARSRDDDKVSMLSPTPPGGHIAARPRVGSRLRTRPRSRPDPAGARREWCAATSGPSLRESTAQPGGCGDSRSSQPVERGRCVGDGIAGARIDLAAAPSLDIANGAPSGEDATDQLVLAWSDGTGGQNHEKTLFAYSTDRGETWSEPAEVSVVSDRSIYSAAAIERKRVG